MIEELNVNNKIKIGPIRTMAKDIARIRLWESEKERKKIIGLKPAAEKSVPAKILTDKRPHTFFKSMAEKQKRLEKETERKKLEIEKLEEKRKEEKEEKEERKKRELEQEKRAAEAIIIKTQEKEKREKNKEKILTEIKEQEELKREIPKIQTEIQKIISQINPLEKGKEKLLEQKKELEEILEPILAREKETEEKINLLEQKERETEIIKKQQEIEKSRWQLEEKRRKIEEKKWAQEKEIKKINSKIEKTDTQIGELKLAEEENKDRLEKIEIRIEEIKLERKKFHRLEELRKIPEQQEPLEDQKSQIFSLKQKLSQTLQEIATKEKQIQAEKQNLEQKEKTAKNTEERQKIESQRWKLEEKIKTIEKQRWIEENKIQKFDEQSININQKLEEIKKQETKLKEKIKEIDFEFLKLTTGEKIIPEKIEEKHAQDPAAIKTDRKPFIFKKEGGEKPEAKSIASEKDAGKPLFIPASAKTAADRTDIQKRLEQARKRVEALRKTIKEPVESFPKAPAAPNIDFARPFTIKEKIDSKPAPVFRPVLKKPSAREKYLIRVLIIAIVLTVLAGIFTFWYWHFIKKEKPGPAPIQPIIEEQPTPPAKKEEPAPSPSAALIPVDNSRILEVAQTEEMPNLLAEIIKQTLPENQLIRIIIKDNSGPRFIELKEFFEILQIKTPLGFSENLEQDLTLFIHSFQQGNRLGFVARIKTAEEFRPKDFSQIIQSWEPTIEQDFENLLLILGKSQTAQTFFKQAKHQNTIFRYLSFPQKDFGICWMIYNDHFVFTTFGKTMFRIIDALLQEKIISEQEAINLVNNLPEVQDWLALFTGPEGTSPITGGKPTIGIDHKENEEYVIHVYEAVPTNGHTVTFNWYHVNSKTGEIKSTF